MINFKLFFESSWYNDTLPERFWDGDRFDPEVRQKLLEIAADVADKAGVVAEVQDVQLTGSMANYNYTKYSDLDVHILLDFADINSDEDLVRAALDGRRFVWNLRHNISIGGHDVELYFQDMEDPHVASGLYSLLNDEWLTIPKYNPPTIDESDVQRKADSVKRHIDELEIASRSINSPEQLAELTDVASALRSKVSSMRKDSLAADGEFGIGNLAFKELRNSGYMEKLIDVANLLYDNQYTD
jgi:predicted nucleotidyltransferase